MKLFMCWWDESVYHIGDDHECEMKDEEFFSIDTGYFEEDVALVLALEVGQTVGLSSSPAIDHYVTRVK